MTNAALDLPLLATADIFLGGGEASKGEGGGEYGSLPTAPYSTTDIGDRSQEKGPLI